ncbi:MAG TPA: FG-GAP-like repeat-containing protein [Pyrinomonadaceae bacterium]|nr:FG-GAP-like repeat-containing protein [Pyrinomonadaceae bacterium]
MHHHVAARRSSLFLCALFSLSLLYAAGCRSSQNVPAKSSKEYNDTVRAFYVGLAALQVGDDVRAESELTKATVLAPNEPAAWANLGLLNLRQRNVDSAAEKLEKARALAPDNSRIHMLLAIMESTRGRFTEAISALRKAIELDPKNLKALYMLSEETERQNDEQSADESGRLLSKILEAQPDNLAVQLEATRIAAKRNDAGSLKALVARLGERATAWPPEVQQQFKALQDAVAGGDTRAAATRVAFLRNVLVRVPEYRTSLSAVKMQPGEDAEPFTEFLRMENPAFTPAPPDEALAFTASPVADFQSGKWDWISAISLNGEGAPVLAVANLRELRLSTGAVMPLPGSSQAAPPLPGKIIAVDFNYDFKTDIVVGYNGGLRFFRQDSPDKFSDVTAQTKLPASLTGSIFFGIWAADIDADGDMDILASLFHREITELRNNGDSTFTAMNPFQGSAELGDFVWADLDSDGDADATFIGDNALKVYINERGGQFRERPVPFDLPDVRALTVADVNNDGKFDLVLMQADGMIRRISDKTDGQEAWEIADVARVTPPPSSNYIDFSSGILQLFSGDLDNNGSLDLVVSTSSVFINSGEPKLTATIVLLSDQQGVFKQAAVKPGTSTFSIADVNGDGRLDMLGFLVEENGQHPISQINSGSKNYHWQQVRPRAKEATGDQRINSFGLGGEMEIRSGLLVQKQLITGPLVHFGLGEQQSADVVRIVWPNGSVRAEFDLKADETILAEQRLKGSCPFLFAYNGKEMKFVKDAVPWSSAIGLRINTLGTARVEATEEWYKIGRDQLVPRDGYYDLRITAELWETYYYDQLALMTVDHPVGTDIFVDERFVIPPAKLAITTVQTPKKIARAVDDNGQDVTETVSRLDGKYLDTFGRGQYQGVTRDHYVEIELGDDAPLSGPLLLIAHGWMHPTDSSINVAISQGQSRRPTPLSLEVPDGKGGWVTARPNLGFPAGRNKISLFDLTGIFRPGTERRLRLRTNLEVYWDKFEWAVGLPGAELRTTKLNPEVADLHYRGYSVINQPDASSPQVPDYNKIASSKQIWRDLIGYYTRFGDVRELLLQTDDRYVIMNAGDEMTFRFLAQPPPADGWVRDYLIVGDGWIKDGDYNTGFSKTILPLPRHAEQEYTTPPGRLEDEEVYRRNPQDWQTFHTRYITPEVFQNALRPRQKR